VIRRTGVFAVILLCSTINARAQSPTAIVNGQVKDTSGAAIPNATVEVINDATRVHYSTQTNSEGIYSVPNLPPGTYHIQVSKTGFKTIVHPNIELHVQDADAIGFTLPVGPASDTVTVEGGVSLINTESAAVGTVVDQTYVKNMPLNGRSFQDLILLTPGVVTASPQSESQLGQNGEFSVNGQRTDSNIYWIDGVSANVGAAAGSNLYSSASASGSIPAATALGTTQALVSVDALEEFRVQSSSYSAEFGRNPGGQFSFVTRSGTNQWHGTAFDYLRNNYFDANDWFNDYLKVAQAPLRQNDFGGTLGGPIEIPRVYEGRDKTFFFFSYEGLRLTEPQEATISPVPTTSLRTSAPSALQPVLNAFPLPQCPTPAGSCKTDLGNGFGDFVSAWSNPGSLDAYSVRLDHEFNDRFKLFFRFGSTPSSLGSRSGGNAVPAPSADTTSEFTSRTYTVGLTSAFSSRISNEVRLNYSSNEVVSATRIDKFGGNTPADFVQLQGLGPGAAVGFTFIVPGSEPVLTQNHQSGIQRQWNLVDSVSLSIGRHQLKFGADYRRLSPTAAPINPQVQYFFFGESEITANSALLAGATSNSAAYPLYTNFSAFAQDEWKATPRLNLSIGLRWELNPAPGVTQGLMPYTLQGSSLSALALAPQGTPLWKTTWFNFAPRLGVAYILRNTPGWETVARGGGGVFFDTGQQFGSLGFAGPGFKAVHTILPAPFPQPAAALTPAIINPPVAPYNQVYYFYPHLQLPYTLQWNGSLQQSLGRSQAVTMSYIGSHAARLLRESVFSGAAISNPNVANLFVNDNGLTAYYGALQVQYQRRLTRGLTALGSYAWSHCIDYGSTNVVAPSLQFVYVRGNCDFDVRHNFNSALSYDLPNFFEGGFARAVLHHWGIDDRLTARTGFPVAPMGGSFVDPTTGLSYNANLDLISGQPIYLYGANCAAAYNNDLGCPGGRAINPAAFCDPSAGACSGGSAPRNFVRGFGAWQMNLAVRREFPIRERLKLQFRAEAFNIFNHPNFGAINQNYCSLDPSSPSFGPGCTFGQATGTLATSLGVLSPLYQTGGPRSMQLALKLAF
jgi:Carboxypeptidase regulatory-like domain